MLALVGCLVTARYREGRKLKMGSAPAGPLLVARYQERNAFGLWCHLQAGNRTTSELENGVAQGCNTKKLLWSFC